ncbi:hypothetical protein REH70_10120 [Cellulomonas sp. ATA003]|nr:PepSY domain-containing protein [Cellulomonas sp. ATA003]WNB84263.1 hypothetical protein REH70_10120 [Cellulomonas sp. ATA003]
MTQAHRTPARRIVTWVGAAALAAGLTACSDDTAEPATEPVVTTPQADDTAGAPGDETAGAQGDATVEEQSGGLGADLSIERGLAAIATAEAAGGVAYELDRDDDGWEVEVVRDGVERDVIVAADGSAVTDERDDDDPDADDQAEREAAQVTITAAIEAAAQGRAEALDGVSLEEEDGTLVWVVDFEGADDDVEVHVSAVDGTVLGER